VTDADHCETPPIAYYHIAPLLKSIARKVWLLRVLVAVVYGVVFVVWGVLSCCGVVLGCIVFFCFVCCVVSELCCAVCVVLCRSCVMVCTVVLCFAIHAFLCVLFSCLY